MVWIITLLAFLFLVKPVSASVVINEFMAKPDDDTEWVEIYNPSNQTIDLTSWLIKDGNTSSSDDITLNGQIDPLAFKTFDHDKGWLNDTGTETIILLNGSTTIDSYQYSGAAQGKTFGRNPDGSSWTSNLTPTKNSSNSQTSSPSPSPTPSPSATSSFTISNIPSEINSDQTFTATVNLTLSNYPSSKFYLKGAFKKSDSSNYFGLTKVNSSWIQNGSSYANQFQFTTDSSGGWSGNLEIQPDLLDSGYGGTGDYIFKVGRYTESGSGPTWSNEINIKLIANEIESEDDLIDLSGIGVKKDSVVLGENIETEKLPEEVYSLEKYRKLASQSGKPSPSAAVQVKSERGVNPLSVIGALLIIGGLLATIITYANNKLRNR